MAGVFIKLKTGKRVLEWTLYYKPQDEGSKFSHHIINQDDKVVGLVKKVGSQYELTFKPTSLSWTRKTFKAKSIKQAILDAVSFWNARKDGLVCSVCDTVFDEPLKLYCGCPTCPEHSNSDWVMSL